MLIARLSPEHVVIRETEKDHKKETVLFCNLILEVTYHHFYHMLLITQNLDTMRLQKGVNTRQGSLEATSENGYHNKLLKTQETCSYLGRCISFSKSYFSDPQMTQNPS